MDPLRDTVDWGHLCIISCESGGRCPPWGKPLASSYLFMPIFRTRLHRWAVYMRFRQSYLRSAFLPAGFAMPGDFAFPGRFEVRRIYGVVR